MVMPSQDRTVEVVRTEFPTIIKFRGVYLMEDFDIDFNEYKFIEVPKHVLAFLDLKEGGRDAQTEVGKS